MYIIGISDIRYTPLNVNQTVNGKRLPYKIIESLLNNSLVTFVHKRHIHTNSTSVKCVNTQLHFKCPSFTTI